MMWKHCTLGEVCAATQGVQITKSNQISNAKDGYKRYLYISDFKHDKKLKYVEDIYPKKNVSPNDLIVSNTGSQGEVYRGIDGILSNNLFKVSVDSTLVDKDFLFHFLKSPLFIDFQNERTRGSTQPHMGHKNFLSTPISLPPLAEQERIVAKLDAAFAEIDEAVNAAIAKETEVKKLKASFLSSSLTGDAVMWKTQKLSDVIEKGETVNPTTNPDTKFSYIDVSSVDRKNFSISKIQTLRGKDAPSRARRLVKTGDVLFATIRPTLQRIAIVPEKLNGEVCSTGYIVLRSKASIICNKFIFYYMLSEKVNTQMEAMQTGASYPAVNDTQVKNLHVSFPSLSEQKLIVSRLDRAFSELKNANEAIVKSKANYLALKSAILSQELQPSEAA